MSATLEEPPTDESAPSSCDTASLAAIGADRLLAEIRRHCFILSVTVRQWEGIYKIAHASVSVRGHEVPSQFRTGSHWSVRPPSWKKKLQPFESAARAEVNKVSVGFHRGIYIVPRPRAEGLIRRLRQLREEYRDTARVCSLELPQLHEQLRLPPDEGLGEHYDQIASSIPSAERLVELHNIETGLWPVGGAGAGEFDEEEAAEWLQEARANTARSVATAVEAMVREPAAEFAAAVDNLVAVADNGRARQGTVEAVRRAYEKLVGFQFLADTELRDRLERLRGQLYETTAQSLNAGTDVSRVLCQQLREVSGEASSDAAALERFGCFERNLDL